MPIDPAVRAERRRIKNERDSVNIVLTKPAVWEDDETLTPETDLAPQTVKVAKDNRPRVVRGAEGEGTELHCVVFGIRNHPTEPDTDIERGYRFELDGDHYVVDYVNLVPGGKQAICLLQGIGT